MKTIKVCLIGSEFDWSKKNRSSGVQRYMQELYENLKKLEARYNVKVDQLSFPNLSLLSAGLSPYMRSFLYNFSTYDIIHNLDIKPIAYNNIGNAKIITTIHDLHWYFAPEIHKEDKMSLRRLIATTFVLKYGTHVALKSDFVFCNSTKTRNEVAKMGFDKRRMFVIPLGIDNRFIKTPIPKRREREIFKVGYIGSLAYPKNVQFAIKAFKMLEDTDAVFEIYGSANTSESHYRYLRSLASVDNRIKLMGFAPEKDLVHIFDSFDVFVHPTLYEGFCLPILEAQSRGLPVIICENAKIPKEVKKYCLEAKNVRHMTTILQNLKSKKYNPDARNRARAYATHFSWERCAEKTLKAYKKIFYMGRSDEI